MEVREKERRGNKEVDWKVRKGDKLGEGKSNHITELVVSLVCVSAWVFLPKRYTTALPPTVAYNMVYIH